MTAITRAAQWTIAAWRFRRAARQAWHDGADLLRTLAAPVTVQLSDYRLRPPADDNARHCASCGGARCAHWRDGDPDACRRARRDEPTAYAAGRALPRDGRHTIAVRLAHWARIDRLHQLRWQAQAAPGWAARRLGRPIELPRKVVALP